MKHPKCQEWVTRGEHVLAGGPATLSKLPSRYPQGLAPSILERGEGPYVTCPDGHTYLDTVAGLGPIVLGHSDPAVNLAVMAQIDRLASSTLSTPLETEVAEMLCARIPGAEQVRYATNGKDVNEAAIKLARHVTGKRHIIYCGYGGGFPDYLITTDKAGGLLPSLSNWNHQVPWRDFEAVDALLYGETPLGFHDDVGAIILEVPPEYAGIPVEGTTAILEAYKDRAHRHRALFILDEVVTGLRYSLGGAQAYYGIQADLVTMSKALGNGVPIAAIMGQRDLMQAFTGGDVFLSTTFGANPLGLAAAKATMLELESKTHGRCQLDAMGTQLHARLRAVMREALLPVQLKGNGARMVLEWINCPGVATAAQLHTLWLQETVKRGILFGVPIFPMCSYTQDVVDTIITVAEEVAAIMRHTLDDACIDQALTVPVIGEVFQRYPAKVAVR